MLALASTPSHAYAAGVEPSQSEVTALIRDRLIVAMHPRKIILFGSRARGEARPDSDYDLLIIQDTTEPEWRRARVARRVLDDLLVSKDISVLTPAEFERLREWKSSVAHAAHAEGVVLYEAAS